MHYLAAAVQTDPPLKTNQENATHHAAASLSSALKGVCTRKMGKEVVGYLHITVSLADGSSGLQDSWEGSAPAGGPVGTQPLRKPQGRSPSLHAGLSNQ